MYLADYFAGKNPPAVCVPIPKFSAFSICTDFSNIDYVGDVASGCVKLSLAVGKWGVTITLATADLGCFRFVLGQMKTKGLTSAGLLKIINKKQRG